MNLDRRTLARLQWLRVLCLLVGTALLALSFLRGGTLFDRRVALVFGLFWLETGLVFLAARRWGWSGVLLPEIVADFALVNALVWFTGGRLSPFVFLYPLLVFVVSLHFSRLGTDLMALCALVAYALIFWLGPPSPVFSAETVIQFFVPLGAMGVSGLLALRLAEELSRSRAREQEARRALFRAEELHRHILRSLASGLVIIDLEEKIVSANDRAREILGQELEGRRVRDFFPNLPELPAGLDPERCVRCELVLERGERRYLGYSVFPLREEKGNIFGYGLLFQDITRVKLQEEKLRQTERLAALGTMASGLVHEIKNPLASICGAVEMLREMGLVAPEGGKLVQIIEREARRLDRLVSDFLLFARPTKGEPREVDLGGLLEELREELLLARQGEEVHLECHVPRDLRLLVEPGRLKQVFLNLFLNACEAAGGRVTIRVSARRTPEGAVVEVQDDAGGVPEDLLPRIFEPFFTTKAEGTGLGLSVVHGLVSAWGGRVEVTNRAGGALFTVFFPREMIAPPPPPEAPPPRA